MSWGCSPALSLSTGCHPFPPEDLAQSSSLEPPPQQSAKAIGGAASPVGLAPGPGSQRLAEQPCPAGGPACPEPAPPQPGPAGPSPGESAAVPRGPSSSTARPGPVAVAQRRVPEQGGVASTASAVPTLTSGTPPVRKRELPGQGALGVGGSRSFPLLTPLFQTRLESEDQGQRGRVTETEWGSPGTAGQARMPPAPHTPPTAAGAQAGPADLVPGVPVLPVGAQQKVPVSLTPS